MPHGPSNYANRYQGATYTDTAIEIDFRVFYSILLQNGNLDESAIESLSRRLKMTGTGTGHSICNTRRPKLDETNVLQKAYLVISSKMQIVKFALFVSRLIHQP